MTERPVRVRFAPSPTGPLHVGGVRTALYNYLFAKQRGGTCILRIEDTDQTRYVEGAEDYIVNALKWLGFEYDEGVHEGGPHGPYRQSERKPMYRQYAENMVENGYAYYAFDTPEEIEAMREQLKAGGMSPKYDATSRMNMTNSLTLPQEEVEKRLQNGDPYVIRIKLPRKEEVRFQDMVRGWVTVHTQQMDDKVLLKADGMPTYHLANVVDDYLMEITHVIRGEEWLPSAPLHVMLYRYLGWEDKMPQFAHLPLILKPDGPGKLSKRDGDRLGFPVFPLEWKDPQSGEISSGYRESGYLPEAVINILALLGWHPSDNTEIFSLDELIKAFNIEKVSKNGAKFDQEKARWFNHQYILRASASTLLPLVKEQLEEKGITAEDDYLARVIDMMKEKVNFIHEIADSSEFFFVSPTSYDDKTVRKKWKGEVPQVIAELGTALEHQPSAWKSEEIQQVFSDFINGKDLKAGQYMQPLRLATSGQAGGPPLFEMIEILGREITVERLKNAAEKIPSQESPA